MLKVLIVDDESIIREGLKTIINWSEYGFEICDTAANGREGLQKVQEHRPDLAIVDIKMPVMDGIKMVEQLKEQKDQCRVIILTAYSDFTYAQKFIELGAVSYILKPVEQEDLVKVLDKVKMQIEIENEARQGIDASLQLSRDKILEGFVTRTIDEAMTGQYIKQYQLDFPWRRYRVGLVDAGREYTLDMKLKRRIRESIEEIVAVNSYGYVFEIDGNICILFRELCDLSLPHVLKSLQEKVDQQCRITVTISVGQHVNALELLLNSYTEAYKLLEHKFLYGQKQIIIGTGEEDACPEADNEAVNEIYLEKLARKLQDAIFANNSVLINNLLEEVKDCFFCAKSDEETIKINYTGLYLLIINQMKATDETVKKHTTDSREVLEEIASKTSLQELHGYLKYRLLTLSEKLACTCSESGIKRILDYIDKNYSGEIKLESLAPMFNYNCNYLGKLFKIKTGMYFNTYLDHVRIEKAKQLLGQGLKVYQVVEKVGICDIDYFYRKFKKYTGVSPSAFKGNDCKYL
jgi:two-component system response regulator YesN